MRHRARRRAAGACAHVAAADVEEPRDRVGRGEDGGVDPLRLERAGRSRAACRRRPRRRVQVVGNDRPARRRRRSSQHRVDQVLGAAPASAPACRTGLEPLDALDRVEPGVVPQPVPGGAASRASRTAGSPSRGDARTVGGSSVAHLQRVAPVDEDRRRIGRDHRQPGRAGEAGEPGQALGAGRTYSPWCSSARGTRKPARPSWASSFRSRSTRSWIVIAWMIPVLSERSLLRAPVATSRARLPVSAGPSRLESSHRAATRAARSRSAMREPRDAPRSWPAPGSRWSDVGAGMLVSALRSSVTEPNGSVVPWTKSAGVRRRGKCATLSSAGRFGGWSG